MTDKIFVIKDLLKQKRATLVAIIINFIDKENAPDKWRELREAIEDHYNRELSDEIERMCDGS